METIENFLAAHPYSAATKQTYKKIILRLMSQKDLAEITAPSLLNLISNQGWGNARQCLALACTQKFIAWRYGSQHPAMNAKLKRLAGKTPRAITRNQADRIFATCNTQSAAGARNLALFALALDTGLRLSELCRLQQADTDTEKRILQVLVKGGRWEFAIFTEQTANYIEHWKKYRALCAPKSALFVNIFTGNALTPHGLQSIVRYASKQSKVKFSMHDFRRGFATIATENGATERDLMLGGRWKSSQMIVKYTRTLRLENMRKYLPLSNEDRK